MEKRLLSFGILLLLAFSAKTQQLYQLTVKDAVDLAYKNVVQLKNARLDYRIQAALNHEITGQALPQIIGTVSANRYISLPKFLFPDASQAGVYAVLIKEGLLPSTTTIPAPVFQQVSFQQPWNLTAGATLTQLLFQPDVFVGLQARQASLDLNTATIEQVMAQIKDSAYKKYYAILVEQKQLDLINQSLTELDKIYHDDSLLYKNGFAEHLDLDKVQVQINNLKTTQSYISSGLILSYAVLKLSLGISQKDSVVLKDDLDEESIKKDILIDSFSYEDRPEIRMLDYTRRLQVLNVKRYKLSGLPTVSLSGNYSVNALGPKFFTNPSTVWLRSSYIGLNLNWPIFTGFQKKYKVEQATLNLEKVENTISQAKQGIDLEQVVMKESLRTAIYNLDIQQKNLALAQRVFNTTQIKYQQGVGSSFEVLQANTDYLQAQGNYFNALYNAVTAKISYQYSIGKL